MESTTEGRRFRAEKRREKYLGCEDAPKHPQSTKIATTSCYSGGTALADLNGNMSVPSLTMRAYSTALRLWGPVSGPLEELIELGMEV
jgi:hypothetical protein